MNSIFEKRLKTRQLKQMKYIYKKQAVAVESWDTA